MADPAEPTTELLRAVGAGDERAVDRIFPLVYDELRRLAAVVRVGRAGETIGATALVHEAYLKLIRGDISWNDRAHFLGIAARAMRQVLVDHAAEKAALKRGGNEVIVSLAESVSGEESLDAEALLDLDHALTELAAESPRVARVVECRFFGGMSVEETAAMLGVAEPTVTRDWRFARAWLTRKLSR